jgi:hypothetical protein
MPSIHKLIYLTYSYFVFDFNYKLKIRRRNIQKIKSDFSRFCFNLPRSQAASSGPPGS